MAWIYCSVRRAHITLQTLWFTTCVQRVIEAPHTQGQYLSNISILHNNKCTFQFDSYDMWWHSDLCFLQVRIYALHTTLLVSDICILKDLNWILCIYQQSSVSARSAHFSALASMWEVLVGKHWDLQPRLPCLLPVQPGLFKICACGSFYYFDLYATGILMYWYLYLLKSLQSLQWICTGDTSCEEKKEARVKVMWKRCDPIHHYSDWDEYALGRLDSCSQGEGKKTIISLRRPGARNNRGVGKIGGMIGTNLFCDF